MALIFQYGLAPNLDAISWQYFVDAWASGCGDDSSLEVCSGNAGVFRAAGAAFLLYCIFCIGEYRCTNDDLISTRNDHMMLTFFQSITLFSAAKCKPSANREAWPAK